MAVTIDTFEHEALFYEGVDGFVAGTLPFLREGLDAGEAMLVAVGPEKIARLRAALGGDADAVQFADMTVLGRNPGRIISAWWDFVDEHPRRPLRGIGEPVWAGRAAAELVECQLHESLMNIAFVEDFTLLCPHDAEALDERVLHEMCCSHPVVDGAPSPHYRADPLPLAPLPPPPSGARVLGFEIETLSEVRQLVRDAGGDSDFVLAVDEVAINSVLHGGGRGIVRLWREDETLVCDVRDQGIIRDPLAGRMRPDVDAFGGRGLWIANAVCQLVQIRPGSVRIRSARQPLLA
jgi:hypothetical protein